MIDDIVTQLRQDEGFVGQPYHDHLGFLTIGYGFLIDERKHSPMPESVARAWLEILVGERIEQVRKAWPPFDDQPEEVQAALVNMAYQLGVRGLMNFRKMLEALERGDRHLAEHEALDSKWAKQTPGRARRVAAEIGGRDASPA